MKYTLELPGLKEHNPRDFLAALGLLRLIDTVWSEIKARLAWDSHTGVPTLTTEGPLPDDFLQQLWNLLREMKSQDQSPLDPVPVEALSSAEHCKKIEQAQKRKSKIEVMILAAMASQIEMEKASRRSDFIIESGQRRVMKGVCDMLAQEFYGSSLLDELVGRAQPVKVSNSSRWNPAEFRSAAYTTTDPAKTDFLDFPGLNVIAFIGLTFYPVIDSSGHKSTPGYITINRDNHFTWPVWSHPLAAVEMTSILHHPALHVHELDHSLLSQIGIDRAWRTRKFGDANNKYFSTAIPV